MKWASDKQRKAAMANLKSYRMRGTFRADPDRQVAIATITIKDKDMLDAKDKALATPYRKWKVIESNIREGEESPRRRIKIQPDQKPMTVRGEY